MILIVSLNPSLDIIFNVNNFCKNKVNRSYKENITPGGKGINVAKTLIAFKEKVKVIGFCGGTTGRILKEELKNRHIEYEFIETQEMTRFAIGINDNYKKSFTVLNGAGSKIDIEKWEDFFELYKKNYIRADTIVLTGSLPPETPPDIYSRLLKEVREFSLLKVLDARDEAFIEGLKEKPDIVKPNKEEMENITKKKIKTNKDILESMTFLKVFKVKYPIISLGKKGAVIEVDNSIYHSYLQPIHGIQWGTGDAFLAGFIVGMRKYQDPLEAIRLACAVGYVKTKYVEIVEKNIKEILLIKEKVKIKKIF